MSLQAVFLDLGNTLLHERPSRFEIYAQVARARGVPIAGPAMKLLMARAHAELPREIDGHFRYSDVWFRAYIRQVFHVQLGIAEATLPELSAELFGRFEDARTFVLYPGARELLETLRGRGLGVGAISNWSARLPRVLRALDIAQEFDFVLCSAIERLEKPDPAIFRAALARAGVRPEAALHAGDHMEKDVAGARAAGIEAVLVDHEGTAASAENGAYRRVRGLFELRSLILDRLA
jgi:putative hydrolase of the HAD superfamily